MLSILWLRVEKTLLRLRIVVISQNMKKYEKANFGVFDNFEATKTKQQLTKLHVQLLHLHAVQDLCSSCVCDK